MEFFFPEDQLNSASRATPEETRVTSLSAQPYTDGRRLRVNMDLTPFQTRPHIEILLLDSQGREAASTNFVEPMTWKLEFTLHARGELSNPYTLIARLYYPEGPSAEPVKFSFEMPPASEESASDYGQSDSQ